MYAVPCGSRLACEESRAVNGISVADPNVFAGKPVPTGIGVI
jgi:hypothetical protein